VRTYQFASLAVSRPDTQATKVSMLAAKPYDVLETKGRQAVCKTAANWIAGFEKDKTRLSALGALLVTVILGLGGNQATAAPFAYVTNLLPAGVSVLDTATNQITATVAFPSMSDPIAAAFTPDRKKVYVLGDNGSVFVMDTATNTVSANPITVGGLPMGIAMTPDGKQVYVACQYTNTVSVIDTSTETVSATISFPSGSKLANIVIAPSGLRAYVTAQGANALYVIDTSTNTVLPTPIALASSPLGIAIAPDGKEIYVTHYDSATGISVVDVAANAVVATIPGVPYLFAVAFTPNGKWVYVPGGGGVGYTLVIDTATRTLVDTIPQGGSAVAITLDGAHVYLTSPGANAVSVIDTATNTLTSTIGGLNLPQSVSTGPLPPGVLVPSVVGDTQTVATAAITGAGLVVGMVTQQANGSIAPGSVIGQVPAAGAFVGANALVGMVVSSGVAVPNVTGQTQAQASTAISSAGLVLGTVAKQASSTVPAGSVISQSPDAGVNVAGGVAVNLVVSSGSGSSGGGGSMEPFTLMALLALLVVTMIHVQGVIAVKEEQLIRHHGKVRVRSYSAMPSFARVLLVAALLSVASCHGGGGSGGVAPSALSYGSPVGATIGIPITALTPSVTGSVSSFSASPALPAGLTLNSMTGVISGTPSVTAPPSTYIVTAANAYGKTTYALSLTVGNPAPTLASITPNSIAAGSPDLVLTLLGTSFAPTSTVLFNGNSVTASFSTSLQMTATVPAASLLTLGDIAVSVQTPTPGGGSSASVMMHVGGPLKASPTRAGASADGGSFSSAISANGRYVAFVSSASNLVSSDANAAYDVFVRDTCVGAPGGCVPATQRASVASDGTEANGDSGYTTANPELGVAISGDGRFVAFVSAATNLVPGDTNGVDDVFVRDTCVGAPAGCTPTTSLASVGIGGAIAAGGSADPAISRSGRFVAFASNAANLAAGDNNNTWDIFVRDTCAGAPAACVPSTARVSVDSLGVEGNDGSALPAFSGDERYVAFVSMASNLVTGDSNATQDVFLRDTCFGAANTCVPSTVRVSLSQTGGESNSRSLFPKVSFDGRYVAFFSQGSNLVAGHANTTGDLYIRDTCINAPAGCAPTTILASLTDAGGEPQADGVWRAALSDDGRYAAFESSDPIYVPTDSNPTFNVFVHDTCIGAPAGCVASTKRLSAAFDGTPADNQSVDPALSADGRFMSFTSYAGNLLPGSVTPGFGNVFVVETH
jgi:YVTN family beta-propeller protein